MFHEYKDVVSVDELCRMLKISKNTAYNLIHDGQIKAVRIGRQYRIPKKNIIKYLDQNSSE